MENIFITNKAYDELIGALLNPLFGPLINNIPVHSVRQNTPNSRPVNKPAEHIKHQGEMPSLTKENKPASDWRQNIPAVKNVVFHETMVNTEVGDMPVTVTEVHFADDSWCIVKRNIADQENKETALAYAFLKRIFGEPNKNNEYTCPCLYKGLHSLVESAVYKVSFPGNLIENDVKKPEPVAKKQVKKVVRKEPEILYSKKPVRDSRGRFVKKSSK